MIETGTEDEMRAALFKALLPTVGEEWRYRDCVYVCTMHDDERVWMVPRGRPLLDTLALSQAIWFECVMGGQVRRVRPISM